MANQRGDEEKYASEEEACEKLIERSRVERARFMNIYGVDYYDYNNFDLVIDTTTKTPDEILTIILTKISEYQNDRESYISPAMM